ncbi:MAG: efflux RND transporter periplasmic adaptor subunit [Kangiellaceae bacterium]|nr:efflux RND transporter periplasmic adaptor subunit [Kangiellaceae bacterium]
MPKSNPKRVSFFVIISILLSLVIASCGGDDQTKAPGKRSMGDGAGTTRAAKSTPVEVNRPELGLAASYYVTTATIEPSSDAKINSRTTGIVKQLLSEEGDDVKAGDILLILDDDDQQLRLKQAAQKLASATREFKRLNKMKKAGIVSPTEWETADNSFQTAGTEKQLAELALSYTRVAAPFDGRVVWREVDLGEHVSQGELLFRMMAINPLLVRVHIPANRLGSVSVGQTVELIVDTADKALPAVVELVSPIVDPSTGTIKITLRLDSYPKQVRPGDFAEVHMITDQHQDALLISSVAIIEERGQHYVYVAEQGIAKRKGIQLGFVMNEKTEVISGINATDQVVVKGQRNLNDDVKVDILSLDGQPSKTANKELNRNNGKKEKGDANKKRASS